MQHLTCPNCSHTLYRNPQPIACTLIPVWHDKGHLHIVALSRPQQSQPDKWALPSCHLRMGETFTQAAKRVASQRLGLNLDPSQLTLTHNASNGDGRQVIVFVSLLVPLTPIEWRMRKPPSIHDGQILAISRDQVASHKWTSPLQLRAVKDFFFKLP